MSTEISVDIAVDIAVDSRLIVGRLFTEGRFVQVYFKLKANSLYERELTSLNVLRNQRESRREMPVDVIRSLN